jgi:hypothetical protein
MSRPHKRRSTFGTSRKLPSGRWQARYLDPTGRRRTADHTFDSKQAADLWLADQSLAISRNRWRSPDDGAVRFADYASEWLQHRTVRARPLRPRTVADYRQLLDRLILPTFGSMRLDGITAAKVKA